ncbi:MAG: phosphatase PAP2 family protein [Aureispira sp.]|nr:phosphatase PAP2 family protein [Aureispira sp.]
MKVFLCCLFLIVNILGTQAQYTPASPSPYTMSWQVDAPIGGLSLGLGLTYILLDRKTKPLTEESIMLLDRNKVWGIDRGATKNWSPTMAKVSDGLMFGSMALPGLLYIDPKVRKDYWKVGVIWAETFALTAALTSLTKVLVKRPRPYTYNPNAPMHKKLERDAQYSFFSGHTSVTASMCFMTAKVFTDYNPGHKATPWVWASAAVVPAVTAYLRYGAGKHFVTDVLIGYLIGAGVGILVPELHKIRIR